MSSAPLSTTAGPAKVGVPPMDSRPTPAKFLRRGPFGFARVVIGLFTRIGERDPPKPSKTKHIRLISVVSSHYVEKVRWALEMLEQDDQSPVYYTEDCHPPGFSAFQTVVASNDQASQTPMIVMNDGRVMWKSDEILLEVSPHLYPEEIKEEVVKMEQDLNYRVGSALRCVGFHHFLGDSHQCYPALIQFGSNYCSWIESFLYRRMFAMGIDKAMRKAMKINQETSDASEVEVRKVFLELSERLESNGGEYLMDTASKKYGFTAVDLTFAALSYHFMQPPQMVGLNMSQEDLPPHVEKLADELRATTAGKHALRIYEKHRPVSETTNEVVVRTFEHRDRIPWMEATMFVGIPLGAICWAIVRTIG